MQSHYSVLFIVVLAMLGAGEEALGKPGTHVFPPATVWEDGSGGGLEALGRNEPSRGDEPPGPRGGSKQVKNRLTQEVLGGTHLGQDEHLSVDTQEEEYDPVFIDMDIGRMLEEGTDEDNDNEQDIIMYVDMETGKIWKEMIENGTMTIELEIEEEIREEILIDEREKIEIDNKEEEENETTKEKIEKSYEEEDYYVEYYYEEEEKMQEEYEEYEENDYEEENKDEEEVMYVDMETWKLWKEIIENGTLTIELEERIEERTEEVMINEREKEKKQEKELERIDKEHGVEKDCNDDNRQATNKGIDDQTKREGNDNHKEKDNDSETDFEDIRVQVTYAAVAEGDVREGPFHIVRIKRKVVLLQLARDASGKITSLPPSHREEVILQTSTPLRQEGYRLVRNGPTLIRADPVIGEDLLLRALGVAAPQTEEDSGGARRDTVSAGARPSHSSHHRDEL